MKLVYFSWTGNVTQFVERTGLPSVELKTENPFVAINEPFIAVVPTYDDDLTALFEQFIRFQNNEQHLQGFAGSGSRNFGTDYCFNAKDLALTFTKPLVLTFEFCGTDRDIEQFKKEVDKIEVA